MSNDPKWLTLAESFVGTKEIPGSKSNPVIVGFWDKGHIGGVSDEDTPWCAAFANAQLESSGVKGTRAGNAKSFLSWGTKLTDPVRGCVVVFNRPPNPWQGHVAFFLGYNEDKTKVLVLGGNQGDSVCHAWFPADRVAAYRWPTGVTLTNSVSPIVNSNGAVDNPTDR